MKNFWLDRLKNKHWDNVKNASTLQEVFVLYHKTPPKNGVEWEAYSRKLKQLFYELADRIYNYCRLDNVINKNYITRILVDCSFEKMGRFNPDKGNAHHYFSTIMMSVLRQYKHIKK